MLLRISWFAGLSLHEATASTIRVHDCHLHDVGDAIVTRVLQVLYSGLGGHGSVAFSLAEAASNANAWDNSLLFMGIEPVLEAYTRNCGRIRAAHGYLRTTAGRPWLAWPRLYRKLAGLRPDAIVLHSVKAILPVSLYARRQHVPLIAVEHQPNALKSRAEWWASRELIRRADGVVVLTEDYRRELEIKLGRRYQATKIRLIPNGIDTDSFTPNTPGQSTAVTHVGMAARMTPSKRQDLLVDAIAQLNASDGNGRWHLSLAGDGEALPRLQELVRQRGLEHSVSFPGLLDEMELQAWFHKLDVYAHASDGETLSTSLLQAMACGLPIVGSDVSGIANLLAEGGGAGLVCAQSGEAFAANLKRITTDGDLAAGLRARARKLATSRYSRAAMFEGYRELLESTWKR